MINSLNANVLKIPKSENPKLDSAECHWDANKY